ncbi:MAG: hypothetical protein ACE5EX_12015, partial [Phycisphaerae bacterium]
VFEPGRRVDRLFDALKKVGYDVEIESGPHATFGKVMAAERLSGGRYVGVSDPRTMGKAMAVAGE